MDNKYGNAYYGNDFLEWWKTHYGTDYSGGNISKTESMTDEDYAVGQTLLANYQKQQKIENDFQKSANNLLENYNTKKGAYDDDKRQAQQNASITLDKLKKYLPMQIKAQGLQGLGVSESTMLDAYNNYMSTMGTIENDYSKKMTALDTAYGSDYADLEKDRNDRLYDSEYDEDAYLVAQANIEDLIAEGKLDEAKIYLESNKTIFGNSYIPYMTGIDQKIALQNEQEEKRVLDEKDQDVLEGKKLVEYNGDQYRILEKIDAKANEIVNNNSFTKGLNALGFSNPYDKDIPDGTTIYINRGFNGQDKVAGWDIWSWHVTYYKGEWYHSEIIK